ncbi:MAG: hypothetical protein PUA50_00035, partial [Eubacteriales bacterium]|nr:hypothetical protein [Eubacteriales bacterium]
MRAEATFKGKTESEWANVFKTDPVKNTVKTGTPSEELRGFSVRTEAEDRVSDTIGGSVVEGDEFSGGKALIADYARDNEVEHSVDFSVTVPEDGAYSLTAFASRFGSMNTTDYDIYVNGEYALDAKKSIVATENISTPSLPRTNVMRKMTFSSIRLSKGENKVSFVLDNSDRQPNKPLFYIDYFDIVPSPDATAVCEIGYTQTPTGDYSKQAIAASELEVYVGSWAMTASVSVATFASEAEDIQTVDISIEDYNGNTVFSDSISPSFGKFLYTADLGKHPTGYFKMKAAVGERLLAQKDYVVLPAVEDRDLELDSPFASDFASYHILADRPEIVGNYAAVAKLTGVSVLRERLDWIYTEWTQGGYDFSRSDSFYGSITEMGLDILPFISNAPRWVTDTGNKIFMHALSDVYTYSKKVAEKYADISKALEIWNETDYFTYVPADMYASFYKAAALGVVDSGTSLPKMIGGLCEPIDNNPYLNILYQNEVFDYSDAFNWHYHIYEKTERPVTEFIDGTKAGQFTNYANTYLKTLPSWCTEAGIKLYPTPSGSDLSYAQQKIQANYMVTSACQSLAAGTDKHFWFILGNMPEDTGWFGSFGSKDQPFASVVTEAVMTQTLGKGIYKGELNSLPSGVEGHVINNGTDDVLVLWSSYGTDVTLSSSGNVLKTSVVGDREILKPTNGKITVSVSPEPVFITVDGCADASIYTATENEPAKAISAKTDFSVGERVVMTQIWYDLTDTDAYLAARDNGYIVSAEGNTITLKLVNFNDFEVSGTVSGAADG